MSTIPHTKAEVPLSRKERGEYSLSLVRSIIDSARGGKASGLCAELSKHYGEASRPGIHIPLGLLLETRALSAGVFTGAGAMVQLDLSDVAEAPRATSVCLAAGATLLTGLSGTLSIPRQTAGETISTLSETATITAADSTFGQLTLTPHRFAGSSSVTSQLESQSGGAASALVMQSLGAGVGASLDRGAIAGNGTNGDVLGLHYAANVGTKTFGGAATQVILTDMKSTALTNDANRETLVWICHPEVEEKWSNIYVNGTGSAKSLWDIDRNTVAGLRAFTTTAAPSTAAVVADMSQQILAVWNNSIEVLVDPFSQSMSQRISFIINFQADVGFLRPTLAVRSTDTVVA